METSYVIFWVLALIVLYVIVKYNWIIKLRNVRKQSFSDIDVQLKLRFNLIPNLINTVKGYAKHEEWTLEKLTKARTSFLNAWEDVNGKMAADNMLSWAMKSIFAVAENYPDLKANTNFMELQKELSDIENKIAASRRFFNSATQEFNTYIEVFPNNVIAGAFNFNTEKMYEVTNEVEKENVKVEF